MPHLILLNGPPGIGKSTLAQRYADDHPLTLNLDIDAIRCTLGQWREHEESKMLARRLAGGMAQTHLAGGHDVIVPQLLARTDFIDRLAAIARETDAVFDEFLLMDTKPSVIERARRRRAEIAAAGDRHPIAELVDDADGHALGEIYEALLAVSRARPATHVIHTTAGRIGEAYEAFVGALASPA